MWLQDIVAADRSEAIEAMERDMREALGFWGGLKPAWTLMVHRGLRRAMREHRRLFSEYGEVMGCAYFVGRMPAPS